MFRTISIAAAVLGIGAWVFLQSHTPAIAREHGMIQAKLFVGEEGDQPLVVGSVVVREGTPGRVVAERRFVMNS